MALDGVDGPCNCSARFHLPRLERLASELGSGTKRASSCVLGVNVEMVRWRPTQSLPAAYATRAVADGHLAAVTGAPHPASGLQAVSHDDWRRRALDRHLLRVLDVRV